MQHDGLWSQCNEKYASRSNLLFTCSTDSSSVLQQRAAVNWCWLHSTFLCGPVITQPLSSVSVSGAFLLNNLIFITQIAVRGRRNNSCISHCHNTVSLMSHSRFASVKVWPNSEAGFLINKTTPTSSNKHCLDRNFLFLQKAGPQVFYMRQQDILVCFFLY